MKYADIRQHVTEHFRGMLVQFKAGIDDTGPIPSIRRDALDAAQGLTGGSSADWAALVHPDGADGLLREFCATRAIPYGDLTADNRVWLLDALQKGHRAYVERATVHADALGEFDLEPPRAVDAATETDPAQDTVPYQDVVAQYFTELERAG